MDYEHYQKLGYPVIPLHDVLKKEYHYIIIAIGNSTSVGQIKNILVNLGVPGRKIVDYKYFLDG